MKERTITGLILIAITTIFILFANKYIFACGIFLVVCLSSLEWINFANISYEEQPKYLAIFCISSIITILIFKHVIFLFLMFWLFAIYRLYEYETNKRDNYSQCETIIYGICALTPFAASLFILDSIGVKWIFLFILVIAGADSGAYFIGKSKGIRKMLPRLSPKKTIEGLVGGFVVSMLIAFIYLYFLKLDTKTYIMMTLVCSIVAITSVIGDVFESMMKRSAGIKDSGNILPGHGGILDRIDGYLPALPLFIFLGSIVGVFSY